MQASSHFRLQQVFSTHSELGSLPPRVVLRRCWAVRPTFRPVEFLARAGRLDGGWGRGIPSRRNMRKPPAFSVGSLRLITATLTMFGLLTAPSPCLVAAPGRDAPLTAAQTEALPRGFSLVRGPVNGVFIERNGKMLVLGAELLQ